MREQATGNREQEKYPVTGVWERDGKTSGHGRRNETEVERSRKTDHILTDSSLYRFEGSMEILKLQPAP